MKKKVILLAVCLMIMTLAACSGSDMPKDFKEITFGSDNSVTLNANNAYAYDEPIIIEGDGFQNFGGWLCENKPGVYWGFTVPEDGNYKVTVTYSRGEDRDARGSLNMSQWNKKDNDWHTYIANCWYFESTGDWSEYSTVTCRYFHDMEKGLTLRFSLRPALISGEGENIEHFINLRSVLIEKWSPDDFAEENQEDYREEAHPDTGNEDMGAETGIPVILTNDEIYYQHESGDGNLQFFPDGRVQLNTPSEIRAYEYSVEDDAIYITDEGEAITELTILDLCTLEEPNGNIYAIPDSEGKELVERNFYYLNAGDEGLLFELFGSLTAQNADGTETEGSYEVDGNIVRVELDGASVELEIINRRLLRLNDNNIFVRLYP